MGQSTLILSCLYLTCCWSEEGSEPLKSHWSHGNFTPSCLVAMWSFSLFIDIYSFSHWSHLNDSLFSVCLFNLCWFTVYLETPWKEHSEHWCFTPSCLLAIWFFRFCGVECFVSHMGQSMLIFLCLYLIWCLSEVGCNDWKGHSGHGNLLPSCFDATCKER